jgi:hypothetical protein
MDDSARVQRDSAEREVPYLERANTYDNHCTRTPFTHCFALGKCIILRFSDSAFQWPCMAADYV